METNSPSSLPLATERYHSGRQLQVPRRLLHHQDLDACAEPTSPEEIHVAIQSFFIWGTPLCNQRGLPQFQETIKIVHVRGSLPPVMVPLESYST